MLKNLIRDIYILRLILDTFKICEVNDQETFKYARELLLARDSEKMFLFYGALSQKQNNFNETIWAISKVREKNPEDKILGNLLASENYAYALNKRVDLDAFHAYAEASLGQDYVPGSPEDRAKCLGSLSMGYALRGDLDRARVLMERALENNPKQLNVENKFLYYIKDEFARALWKDSLLEFSQMEVQLKSKKSFKM